MINKTISTILFKCFHLLHSSLFVVDRSLLQQCDDEGLEHNGLVPTFHCMHTPGGPLKYSMEGHQFAIFAMRLTSDSRYIVSVSNRFITFDVVTSDLAGQVYPGVEGLMMGEFIIL